MLSDPVTTPAILLVFAVAAVGVLHTVVPDHWVPITLIARQRGWSRGETARAALMAGTGHVVTTLIIALIVWFAGIALATRFGNVVDIVASLALVLFGCWIAVGAWRELQRGSVHGHSHGGLFGHHHHHGHDHGYIQAPAGGIHGPELQRVDTGHGVVELSIFEAGVPPRFRFTGPSFDQIHAETIRADGARQLFTFFANQDGIWESRDEIPEPHGFRVNLMLGHGSHNHNYQVEFVEHTHGPHFHDHGRQHGGTLHNHAADIVQEVSPDKAAATHKHRTTGRTGLLLILGSSPMVEGIPAFFAASRYGVALLILMAVVFAASTIVTYVALCVCSTVGLQRVNLGPLERYGEVISGVFISLVGVVFGLWPIV